jgi:hypothetical protein
MVNKSKKHRSHVSSKETRVRGWRKIPRKGTGKRTMLSCKGRIPGRGNEELDKTTQ